MMRRCYDTNFNEYKNYGFRGITVCDEWHDVKKFYNWAINNGFQDGLSIDRIDVNGNYEPNNCRWVNAIQQMNNKRNNIFLEYNGQTMTLAEWARQDNITVKYNTILKRYHLGWSAEDILFKEI